MGIPQNGSFRMKNPMKINDFGGAPPWIGNLHMGIKTFQVLSERLRHLRPCTILIPRPWALPCQSLAHSAREKWRLAAGTQAANPRSPDMSRCLVCCGNTLLIYTDI
jgi:hypothetical protein